MLGKRRDARSRALPLELLDSETPIDREAAIRSLFDRPYSKEMDEIFRLAGSGRAAGSTIPELHRAIASAIAHMPGDVW